MTTRTIAKQVAISLMACGAIIFVVASAFGVVAGSVAIVLSVASFIPLARSLSRAQKQEASKRGRTFSELSDAKRRCDNIRPELDPGILWGKLRIPSTDARWHFCVVGAVGSGKTLTIRMLMQDQLPLIKPGSDRRALVYDAKQDMVPIIGSMKPPCPVYLLNPFDKRASAWNIASDVDSPAAARQLAVTLVPDNKESQPFFTNAVRELLVAVVVVFLRTRPGKWTLREVLLVMKSKELLREVLGRHQVTRNVFQNFLESGEVTIGSIMATVTTKLGPYEPIAAAWEHAKRQVSVKEWLHSESILILGNDERIRASLDTVNQLFVAIAAQHVLAMTESTSRMNWFFFDEFREAGKLLGLESIILRGRSKGCCVVLGFQDIQGVQHVYEEKLGNELVGQCGNKALLRIESPETAEWASKSVGEQEKDETNESWTTSSQGRSTTQSSQRRSRSQVMASEFMEIPVTNTTNGLHGVYLVRSVGAYRARYAPSEINEYVGHIDERQVPFVAAPTDWQYLRDWDADDSRNVGIQPLAESASPTQGGKKSGPGLDGIGRVEL